MADGFGEQCSLAPALAMMLFQPSDLPELRDALESTPFAHFSYWRTQRNCGFGADAARTVRPCPDTRQWMPVMLATKVEFIMNNKAAKALNIPLNANLLSAADEVIE